MIKLEEKETPQTTFDFVVGKLREQGEPSVGMVGSKLTCIYGKPGGCRCAVGHLLGDNEITGEYRHSFGSMFPLAGAALAQLISSGVVEEPVQRRLITEMQVAHDDPAVGNKLRGAAWARACAKHMLCVALTFNLSSVTAVAWLESLQ